MSLIRIKTISEFHALRGLPKPEHPLISVIDYGKFQSLQNEKDVRLVFDYYSISVKQGVNGKLFYGQQEYDFNEGVMYFMAPNQVLRIENNRDDTSKPSGWMLLIHPDFFGTHRLLQI